MAINPDKLNELVGKAVGDLGVTLSAALIVIGDKLGLFRAMKGGPVTPEEVAGKTGTVERYVREWLAAQAAAGYVCYDAKSGRYFLSEEQAECLTNEESPACVVGGFQAMIAAVKTAPKVMEGFRTGKGVGWHEHDADLFQGTERFFRPGYNANLVGSWIPSLDGVTAKLEAGAVVADVGCGRAHVGDDLRIGPADHQTDGVLELIVANDLSAGPIVEVRSRRLVSLGGDPVGDLLDVGVEAERLLHDDDGGQLAARSLRSRHVHRHRAVGGLDARASGFDVHGASSCRLR